MVPVVPASRRGRLRVFPTGAAERPGTELGAWSRAADVLVDGDDAEEGDSWRPPSAKTMRSATVRVWRALRR